MFTGIVEGKGNISKCVHTPEGSRLVVHTGLDFSATKIGDSVAINGTCLTVVETGDKTISFDVVNETLRCTTLGKLIVGSEVNLERSMKLGDRIDGHIVSGHVDGIVKVLERCEDGTSIRFTFELPRKFRPYVASKGSVCLAGVSLTVGEVTDTSFCVYIIPHTASQTILGALSEGDEINLEVDLFARYIESYLTATAR